MPYSVSPARTVTAASAGIAIGAGGRRTGAGREAPDAREVCREGVDDVVRDEAG